MPYVNIDVNVDLDDFEDEDIAEEYEKRNLATDIDLVEADERLKEIYYALKFGMDEKANELTRLFVCDALGVIL